MYLFLGSCLIFNKKLQQETGVVGGSRAVLKPVVLLTPLTGADVDPIGTLKARGKEQEEMADKKPGTADSQCKTLVSPVCGQVMQSGSAKMAATASAHAVEEGQAHAGLSIETPVVDSGSVAAIGGGRYRERGCGDGGGGWISFPSRGSGVR